VNIECTVGFVKDLHNEIPGIFDPCITEILDASLHSDCIHDPVTGDVTEKLKNADEIGFAGSVGPNNDIEPGQVDVNFRETLEIPDMDTVDGHGRSLVSHRHRATKRRYW
jgi:hypothetical protein